ncbi:MAG: Rieske (2Fe-2S) protein [Alphaproteobacteria bacterium]
MKLCDLSDVEDGGSNGFFAEIDGRMESYIVIRRGDAVIVYINSCPHIGTPLDFQPGKFLNPDKTHILCSSHGALFRIEDGLCVSGPCPDQSLTPVPVHVRDGAVYLSA